MSASTPSPYKSTREPGKFGNERRLEYWRHVLDNAKDDTALYKAIGWHKLELNNQEPPLVVGNKTITDTREKAEALRTAILTRFSADDDLPLDIDNYLQHRSSPERTLPWETFLSPEEKEKSVIGIASTSLGPDCITVRLLRACWMHIGETIRRNLSKCLELNHYPANWKLGEVSMIPKVGKEDNTLPRSWTPIALLSCLGVMVTHKSA